MNTTMNTLQMLMLMISHMRMLMNGIATYPGTQPAPSAANEFSK